MMDPQRLVLGEASDFERILLDSGAAERIPPEMSARMAASLQLPFAGQPSLQPPPPPALAGAAGGSTSSVSALLLTLGMGTVVVGSVVGGAFWHGHSNTENPGTSTAASATVPPALPREVAARPLPDAHGSLVPPASEASPTPPPSAPSSDANTAATHAASTATSGGGVKRRAASDIEAELRLLDGARAAIARGDQQDATRLLSRYDAEFPRGELRRESRMLWKASQSEPTTLSRTQQRH